ncbi:response regulator transcription factor [Clostridium sp. DL1XJH146]
MSIKVLLIEDEESIRKFTKIVLRKEGYIIFEAGTGEEGLEILALENPDIVLLDIMLPGINGFEVCDILRKNHPTIGVIMLTARGQNLDKVKGLQSGADDYMVKPFNPIELSARIQSLLRRLNPENITKNNLILSGPFKIALDNKKAYKGSVELNLTPKEFLLLKIFIENKNKALSRGDLLDIVWGYNFVGDPKIVDVNIRRLRSKLEDDASNPKYIETVWGMGYRWKEN